MSISIKITTFLRFLVFLYELAPGRKNEHLQNAPERQNARCTFAKTPRSAKTLDVLGKRGPHIGPHVQLSGLMFNCVQLCTSVFNSTLSGASSYPTPTTHKDSGILFAFR